MFFSTDVSRRCASLMKFARRGHWAAATARGAVWLISTWFVPLAALRAMQPPAYQHELPPRVVPHERWQTSPPLGYPAVATRRNRAAGDTLSFGDLVVVVQSTAEARIGARTVNTALIELNSGTRREQRKVREGEAFNWGAYHVAIVAIYGPKELGAGLVALEIGQLASLPSHVADAVSAGAADMRLRIPHRITHVTLHHTGDTQILSTTDDPVMRLRNLQAWGARDRNWWDVPYHFLLGLDGLVFEGRDWRFTGETNTAYDPTGHFLISVIGNYDLQEPTPKQLDAIADLMAWALKRFNLPLDRIGGHYHYAKTGCPGRYLRRPLEDGTLKRMVAARLR